VYEEYQPVKQLKYISNEDKLIPHYSTRTQQNTSLKFTEKSSPTENNIFFSNLVCEPKLGCVSVPRKNEESPLL